MKTQWTKTLLLTGLCCSFAYAQSDPPEILRIRENYNAVNAKIEGGQFTKESKETPYCRPGFNSWTRWLDSRGVMRQYTEQGGSDDSGVKVKYWFDQAGRLDFVLVQYGNVHGGNAELRVYYNDKGEIIRSRKSGNPSYADLWAFVDAQPQGRFETSAGSGC